jgi:hypothetical protein
MGEFLDSGMLTVLQTMLQGEKLNKSMSNHLAYVFRQLFDASRLVRGQSTQNVSQQLTKLVQSAHLDEPAPEPGGTE